MDPGLRRCARASVLTLAIFAGAGETPASTDDPQAAYDSYCLVCHGVGGQGVDGLGVSLVESAYVESTPADELVNFLKIGRLPNDPATVSGRPMPGFAYVDDSELRAIVGYLKQLRRPETASR